MSVAMALIPMLGKAVANKLTTKLINRPNGAQKMEAANTAMQQGMTAVEALKSFFGEDFLRELNAVTGGGRSSFSYEAGTADYIKADTDSPHHPLKVLRDELSINLDRVNLMETKGQDAIKNYFRGMFHVWKGRYQELAPDHQNDDAKATLDAIGELLSDDQKTFKDLFQLTSVTGLGVGGALFFISAVCLATSTGVGIVAAISAFLFGIPWLSVAGLAIPGALMLGLAAMQLRDDQAMSACVQLAYKLIERQMAASAQANQPSHQPITEREQ